MAITPPLEICVGSHEITPITSPGSAERSDIFYCDFVVTGA